MAANSKIEWTWGTFNPWRGCTKIAAGCANCYAATLAPRNPKTLGVWGDKGTRVVAVYQTWDEVEIWNRKAGEGVCPGCNGRLGKFINDDEGMGYEVCETCLGYPKRNIGPHRRRIFVASLADVFEDYKHQMIDVQGQPIYKCRYCGIYDGEVMSRESWDVGEKETKFHRGDVPCKGKYQVPMPATMHDVRLRLFRLIDKTPWLDYLLVTKRGENIRRFWPEVDVNSQEQADDRNERGSMYRRNVWLIHSIAENKDLEQLDYLKKCRDLSPVLGVSAEPLIERVNMQNHLLGLDWMIIGGESGHNPRPCDIEWIRSLRDQCQGANVPVFVKQMGAGCVTQWVTNPDPAQCWPTGTVMKHCEHPNFAWSVKLKDAKGGDWNEWPEDLRVRESPKVSA